MTTLDQMLEMDGVLNDHQRNVIETVISEGGIRPAARKLQCTHASVQEVIRRARIRAGKVQVPIGDPIPPKNLPIEDIIAQREKAHDQRRAHARAMAWRRFHIPARGPYALMFFGDPHLDDDGCDLNLFKNHATLAANTEALYAVNIGDTTNNWTGRLAKLWAHQDASAETARLLVKHYLADSGIPWFLWLHGNHDLWDGPVGRDVFERFKPNYVQMSDWQAKVTLVSPNGHELRLWAAHNFKGNSIWNNMHGLERAAQMQDWAHLYVAGHHHDCGVRQGENSHRKFVYNLMRVRGYKFMDDYADHHGFGEYQYGAAGVAVIDPNAEKPNAVTCFLDPFEAVEYLTWKRSRAV